MNPTVKTIRNKEKIIEKITISINKCSSLIKVLNAVDKLVYKYGENAIISYQWHNPYKVTIFYQRFETDEEFIIRQEDITKSKTPPPSLFNRLLLWFKNLKHMNR